MKKRGRKPGTLQNARDQRGWMIPRAGTTRRAVYDLLVAGKSRADICAALGLSGDDYRLHYIRITQGPRAIVTTTTEGSARPCLCCKQLFASEWIGNRLCPPCAEWGGIRVMPGFNRDSEKAGAA